MQPLVIQRPAIGVALAISAAIHVVLVVIGWLVVEPPERHRVELVDIELAPAPPPVEALPAEVARLQEADRAARVDEAEQASSTPPPGEGTAIDAGVDAPPDAPPDARPRPDAAIDAGVDAPVDAEPLIALADAGVDAEEIAAADDGGSPVIAVADAGPGDAVEVAVGDAGATGDATHVATGEGSGSGGGSGVGSGALAIEAGSGSGIPGVTTEPGLDGAPTTAGTAANLLAYFPAGHTVTALIRFDRLRGTEWAAQTERLMRPMPDYRVLFGPRDAKIFEKLETLVISTPRPRDATATTLVARTRLGRGALRDFLGATTAIAWSPSKGGLLGRRTGKVFPGDKRLFLSPFKGWFLFAQPGELPGLTAAAPGTLDGVEATAKLPPWLAGIRKIEAESGDPRGPALVLTLSLGGQRVELGDYEFMLGIKSAPLPDRISLALELVKQGWLVRGNIRFASDAAATEFVTAAQGIQQRITGSSIYERVLGKAAVHVVANLSFARTGPRVSYTTSISIADMRQLMAVAAQQLDSYYRGPPP